MKPSDNGAQFRFRRNDNVGSAQAELDDKFLETCFVETGDLAELRNTESPKRIIVGRTGAGKSALIRKLAAIEEHVIDVPPENLSLGYIANSDVLQFFETAGVNLDLFYQLLWRHVLTVELIKHRYDLRSETQTRSFLDNLSNIFGRDRAKTQAVQYLKDWGEKFWNETEYRVKEITSKVESELKASLGGGVPGIKLDAAAGQKLTEEQKREVIHRGNQVVNQIQIKALSDLMRVLAEDVFNDPLQRFFITIDSLDEHWVDERFRYKLIRALIETAKSFQKIPSVKIVLALRVDLLRRVVDATKAAGFQEEKYESMYLRLRWSKDQIAELLDRRIVELVRNRYTSRPIHLKELFPAKIGRLSFLDYLTDRTFLRPRDAILFVNDCLTRAEDRHAITTQIVHDAEAEYSRKRRISLVEEWSAIFPFIDDCMKLLERRDASFTARSISEEDVRAALYEKIFDDFDTKDPVLKAARDLFVDEKGTLHGFVIILLTALYEVGAVGIKADTSSPILWSHYSDHKPSPGSIKPNSQIYIHPTFWRTLGTRLESKH